MHYLYKITNKINGKCYIGQSKNVAKRWSDHRRAAEKNQPTQLIHEALIKHGLSNFHWEVIAVCKNQDDANELETILVKQYSSYINLNGYNGTDGGNNSPKTEEWKQMLREWHASMTEEEKKNRAEKLREATIRQIEEKGHPSLGKRRSPEQREKLSYAQRHNRKNNYTDEMRQRMSEKQKERFERDGAPSDETIEKRRQSVAETVKKRQQAEMEAGLLRCQAPGCDFSGVSEFYMRVNGQRYCPLHGRRLKQYGSFDKPPSHSIGKKPGNTHKFTEEQILAIINDPRGSYSVANDYGVTGKVIIRVRKENAHLKSS